MQILAKASLVTAASSFSALACSVWYLMIRGKMAPTIRVVRKMPDDVTSASSQFLEKATMMAPILRAVHSTSTPSFSEMPSCRLPHQAVSKGSSSLGEERIHFTLLCIEPAS